MSKGRILLVDDRAEFLKVLIERLEARGYAAVGAAGGPQALEALGEGSFDAVVLDMVMPGMDGLETLERLRRADPLVPVIMLTGYGSSGDVVQALAMGATDYLVKPADLDMLLERINEAMAGRGNP